MILRFLGAQWLAVGFVGVVSFLLSIFIARTMGPDLFGVYGVALAGGAVAAIAMDCGFGKLMMRERARASTHLAYLGADLPSYAFGHAVSVAAALSIVALMVWPQHAATVIAAIWCYAAVVVNQIGLAMLRGDGRMVRDAGWQIGNRATSAACVTAVLLLGMHQPWAVLAAQFVGATAFCVVAMRSMQIRLRFGAPLPVYGVLLPLVWMDLATVVYFRGDMLLLDLFDVAKSEVGHYSVAFRLIEAILMIASPVGVMLFRWFRRSGQDGLCRVRGLVRPGLVACGIGLVLAVGFRLLAEPLVLLAYGDAYRESAEFLAILSLSLIFMLPAGVLIQAALAMGLERWCAVSATVAAVINLGGNLLFIPANGAFASAWLTVVTEVFLCAGIAVGVWKARNPVVLSVEGA